MEVRPATLSLTNALTAVILMAAVGVAFRPNGILGGPLREWLEERKRATVLRESWSELTATPEEFISTGHVARPEGDPVIIFSDYTCRFCRELYSTLDSSSTLPKSRLLLRHFPLNPGPATAAVKLAMCAVEAGSFPFVHHALFTRDDWLTLDDPEAIARAIGLVPHSALDQCLNSERVDTILAAEAALRRRLGIQFTPTVVGIEGFIHGMPRTYELDSLAGL